MRTYDQAEKYKGAYNASMAQKFDEGIEAGIKKVTRNLVAQGISIEVVASACGLTYEELTSLLSEKDSETDDENELTKQVGGK